MTRRSPGSTARWLRPIAAGVLLLALGLAQMSPAPASADTQQELDQARKRVERLEDEFKAARARLEQVRAHLQGLTTRISQATSQVELLTEAIGLAEAEIRRSVRKAQRLQGILNERARDAYILGPVQALVLVLEADSLSDLSDRLSFLEVLSRDDVNVATGVQVEKQQTRELQANLRTYREEYQSLLQQLEGAQAKQQALFEKEAAAEAAVEEQLAEAKDLVDDLEKKLQRELLAQYGFSGNAGPPLKADGPFYWCPVDPPRSYIDDFGAPRVGHTHQGNDIFAPAGTAIRAPFAGTAEEGFDGLGGIVVHVYADANADYVYNAHLSQHVGVDGQHVEPGQQIGLVGTTGNASGTPPHDHFEYHPGGGSAVSPYLYLNEVCGVGGAGF